jgi:predicted Rossmann fold flavoprotein
VNKFGRDVIAKPVAGPAIVAGISCAAARQHKLPHMPANPAAKLTITHRHDTRLIVVTPKSTAQSPTIPTSASTPPASPSCGPLAFLPPPIPDILSLMPPPAQHFDLVILGAGAAGMMAAIAAAESPNSPPNSRRLAGGTPAPAQPFALPRIALFDKNPRPGIKVLVCGGGRCNFTNAGTTDDLIAAFGRNGRFLTPALRHLDNQGLRDFFAGLGVPSHVEPGGKVYPDSNQARSVVEALVRRIEQLGVRVFSGSQYAVTSVETSTPPIENQKSKIENRFFITTAAGTAYASRFLLLALGGMSYQRMGTVGDGYRFAAALGHSIVTPRPAIVGLIAGDAWVKDLQGLAVRNVEVEIVPPRIENRKPGGGKIENSTSSGDLLFTHFGLSGPAILNPSEIVAALLETSPTVGLHVDFLPRTSHEAAHGVLRQWQQRHGKKRLRTMLADPAPEITITATSPDQTAIQSPETPIENRKLKIENPLTLPARLAVKLCELEQISPDQPCATLTSAQIHRLVERLKRCPFTITATRGFAEAMVTAGGVSLREVDPRTLESKTVPGLFLAGELLDLTGPSGGYNLQLAFSTGHLAGTTIARRLAGAAPAVVS